MKISTILAGLIRSLPLAMLYAMPAWAAQGPALSGRDIAVSGMQQGTASCAACHGADGSGNLEMGIPRLSGLPQDYLARQLAYFADGERQSIVMAPYAKALTTQQQLEVSRYFAALPAGAPDTPAHATQAQIDHGRNLYENGLPRLGVPACVLCHGAAGRGIAAFSPPLAGQSAAYASTQLYRWRAGQARGPAGKFMVTVSQHLSDADIDAVSVYLAGLPAASGTQTSSNPTNGDGK